MCLCRGRTVIVDFSNEINRDNTARALAFGYRELEMATHGTLNRDSAHRVALFMRICSPPFAIICRHFHREASRTLVASIVKRDDDANETRNERLDKEAAPDDLCLKNSHSGFPCALQGDEVTRAEAPVETEKSRRIRLRSSLERDEAVGNATAISADKNAYRRSSKTA